MIKNKQQLKAARRELLSLHNELVEKRFTAAPSHDVVAKVNSRVHELRKEISEFERLHSENSLPIDVSDLRDVGDVLIAARIARGITQMELAGVIGVKMQQIQAYEADQYRSASLNRVIRLADALDVKIRLAGELMGLRVLRPIDIAQVWRFPLGEMYARGWIGPEHGLMKDVRRDATELLADYFADSPALKARRRRYARTNGPPHEAAIAAWETRVTQLATLDRPQTSFRPASVNRVWLRELARLSAVQGGGKRARQHLRDVGINLIVESDLPPARIDAGVLRLEDTVAIALTLRDPREERFWPQLMHAVAHAALHVGTGTWDAIFDQSEAEAEAEFEEEADHFAREALIPSSAWETCLSRVKPTAQVMLDDAKRLGVSISVLVWRLKMELGEEQMPRLTFGVRYVRKDLTLSEERDGRR